MYKQLRMVSILHCTCGFAQLACAELRLTLRVFFLCNIHNNLVVLISHVEGIVDPSMCLHLFMLLQVSPVNSQLIIRNGNHPCCAFSKAQACMQPLVGTSCVSCMLCHACSWHASFVGTDFQPAKAAHHHRRLRWLRPCW